MTQQMLPTGTCAVSRWDCCCAGAGGGGRVGVKGMCMQRVLNCDPAAAIRKVRYVKVGPMLC